MDRARRGVAVGDLVGARPAGLCLATAGEQADGRSGRGAHCGAVRPHGRSRARVRRPHHPAYVRDQRRRSARLPRRHRRQAHGAARGPEERQEFCRPGAERDLAGQAGVRHHVARLRLLDQIWVVQRWDFAKIRSTGLELTHRRERFETRPTALELPQLCIGLHRLLSSQCHLSSVVAWRSVAIYEHAPSRPLQPIRKDLVIRFRRQRLAREAIMAAKEISVKKYVVRLSGEERERLETLIRKGKSPARRVLKARILLKADVSEAGKGWSDNRIIEALETSPSMVYRVRKQLVEEGFEAVLSRKPRAMPAIARIFDGEKEAKLIALACSKPPKGRARWTLRLLENKVVEL